MLNTPAIKHDLAMANQFLDLLTGSKDDPVTFQFFSDRDKKNRRLAVHRTMKRPFPYDYHHKKQDAGCGVYVMVNNGDGKGRAQKNVVKVRALFVDLDGAPWEPAAEMLQPHMQVESSPGRYHLYWLVSDCSLVQFKPLQQAIAKKFNGDAACCDLPRVMRVPGFLHLKDKPFLTRLFKSNDFPRFTTQQVIDGLGLVQNDPATATQPPRTPQKATDAAVSSGYEYVDNSGEVHNLTTWTAKNPQFDIVGNFSKQYARGEIKDGKQHIQCPFENEHTDPNPDLSTFIVNARPPEYRTFDIHCMHSHCAGRDRLSFLAAMLNKGMLSAEILQTPALQMRKPPYANYPAQVIAETLQLRKLEPDELRILLHTMHLSFCEDGTLPNDDWTLARSLGVNETTWQTYKDTLTKTGWLTVEADRLFSPIFRQEFVKAQLALMQKIKAGSTGGKKSAANKASTA